MSAREDAVLSYVERDLPAGVTIADYRRARTLTAKRGRRRSRRGARALLRRLTRRCGREPAAEEGTP